MALLLYTRSVLNKYDGKNNTNQTDTSGAVLKPKKQKTHIPMKEKRAHLISKILIETLPTEVGVSLAAQLSRSPSPAVGESLCTNA